MDESKPERREPHAIEYLRNCHEMRRSPDFRSIRQVLEYCDALEADRDALRAQLAHALAVWREFWSERQVRTGNERAYWTHRMEAALTGAGEERSGDG